MSERGYIRFPPVFKFCIICKLQPGDIVEVIPTNEEIIKYY